MKHILGWQPRFLEHVFFIHLLVDYVYCGKVSSQQKTKLKEYSVILISSFYGMNKKI